MFCYLTQRVFKVTFIDFFREPARCLRQSDIEITFLARTQPGAMFYDTTCALRGFRCESASPHSYADSGEVDIVDRNATAQPCFEGFEMTSRAYHYHNYICTLQKLNVLHKIQTQQLSVVPLICCNMQVSHEKQFYHACEKWVVRVGHEKRQWTDISLFLNNMRVTAFDTSIHESTYYT